MYVTATLRGVRAIVVVVEKQQVLHILSVCIQHAMRNRYTVTRGLPSTTIYFPRYFIKGTIFGGKNTEGKMCALIVSINMAVTFCILKRNGRDVIQNVHRSSRKVSVILVRF